MATLGVTSACSADHGVSSSSAPENPIDNYVGVWAISHNNGFRNIAHIDAAGHVVFQTRDPGGGTGEATLTRAESVSGPWEGAKGPFFKLEGHYEDGKYEEVFYCAATDTLENWHWCGCWAWIAGPRGSLGVGLCLLYQIRVHTHACTWPHACALAWLHGRRVYVFPVANCCCS